MIQHVRGMLGERITIANQTEERLAEISQTTNPALQIPMHDRNVQIVDQRWTHHAEGLWKYPSMIGVIKYSFLTN